MTDLESAKAKLADALESFIQVHHNQPFDVFLDGWVALLSKTDIASFNFSFNPRDIDDGDDEFVFSKSFYFRDQDQLRSCCLPGSDCLAGNRSVPIGAVNDDDYFLYVATNLELGIAIIHHEDAYFAEDLDALVEDKASRLQFPIQRFVQILVPETELVILGKHQEGSKWLMVENLGSKVRYESNLNDSWSWGEKEFDEPKEAEAFFFEFIRQGCASTRLQIVRANFHLMPRIESMLNPV